MVNLAFIISFVASAVFLLVAIIIFSEVTEAMELTLPVEEASTTLPAPRGDIEYREHGAGQVTCSITAGFSGGIPELSPSASGGGGTDQHCAYYIVSDLDPAQIQGKELLVQTQTSGGINQVRIFDGAYDHSSLVDFPSGSPLATKGNGLLQLCYQHSGVFGLATLSGCIIDVSSGTEDQVTVMYSKEGSGFYSLGQINIRNATTGLIHIQYVMENSAPPFQPSIRTIEQSGTSQDHGFYTPFSFTFNGVNQTIAGEALSAGEQQQVETFNNALAIGFTVIGILPIALFFALFAILDPRMGGMNG